MCYHTLDCWRPRAQPLATTRSTAGDHTFDRPARDHTFQAGLGVRRACPPSAAKSIAVGAERWIDGSIAKDAQPFCASHAAAAALAHAERPATDEVAKLHPELRFCGLSKGDAMGLPQWPPAPEQ